MILWEVAIICGYLFNEMIGFLLTLLLSIYIFFKKRYTFLEKILCLMILTMPTYNVGFIGDKLHHFLSWCNIYSYFLIIYLCKYFIEKKIVMKKECFISMIFVILALVLRTIISSEVTSGLFNVMQVALMITPIILVFSGKEILRNKITKVGYEDIKKFTIISTVATSIGVIIQYFYFENFGKIVGQITVYPDRISCDLLFKAYSVLSLYIGIGLTFNIKEFLECSNIKNVIYSLICLIGIIFNSARTGIVASLIVCCFMIPKKMKKAKKPQLNILIIIIGAIIGGYAVNYMLASRNTTSLMDGNNRLETYIYGMSVLMKSPINFILGGGLSLKLYNSILPHNFFLETLTTMGIVNTIIIFTWIFILLKYLKNTDFKYIVWHILIGSMFITNFQGNTFATIYFVIAILCEENMRWRCEEIEKSKCYNTNV